MELLIIMCAVLWIAALVALCSRRDIEIHRKLSWVVTVLVLNALGGLLYFIFGPKSNGVKESFPIDPDAKPVSPENRSWNPILGENPFPPGQGLNPKEESRDEERRDSR